MSPPARQALEMLQGAGIGRGDLVGLVVAPGVGLGLAAAEEVGPGRLPRGGGPGPAGSRAASVATEDPGAVVQVVEDALRPRWVVWSSDTASTLVRSGVRIATCWDVAAVHRFLVGGWRADPGRVWASVHDLAADAVPTAAPPDLFTHAGYGGDPDDPVRADGYLRAEWAGGAWGEAVGRLGRWAELAAAVASLQQARLAALTDRPHAEATARSESAAELLCAEMSFDGLPMDRAAAEELLAGFIGPRPRTEAESSERRAARDAAVLRHAPAAGEVDLRSTGQVRSLLRLVGVDVPDTRASRLTAFRDAHPLVPALLAWRKAERMATTYGYAWLDEHLGVDGRLRGAWSSADGAAGRMTASAGLHNMPADLRSAVAAEPGQIFVRADLGQIEPRVLAAVSGDAALARATEADDLYAPVAAQLGVDRPTAKVAVLGAMYGQTTGHGAQAMRRLRATYPVAVAYLEDADRAARAGHDLRTYGGRLIPMALGDPADPAAGARAAGRGRYGRNAVVQGAAAELFKVWAATVRARGGPLGATVVLCLHDELLVQAPAGQAGAVAALVASGLDEAVRRWAPDDSVRFVADISVIRRWSDAKS